MPKKNVEKLQICMDNYLRVKQECETMNDVAKKLTKLCGEPVTTLYLYKAVIPQLVEKLQVGREELLFQPHKNPKKASNKNVLFSGTKPRAKRTKSESTEAHTEQDETKLNNNETVGVVEEDSSKSSVMADDNNVETAKKADDKNGETETSEKKDVVIKKTNIPIDDDVSIDFNEMTFKLGIPTILRDILNILTEISDIYSNFETKYAELFKEVFEHECK